jgi:regulatory protein
MAPARAPRARPALNPQKLEELAIRYVGRYATTRAKLSAYLARKLRERGWDGHREPDVQALSARFAELGYIDDSAYALSKAQALAGRGYGKRRVVEKLRIAGVAEDDGAAARAHADSTALTAALRFAERRRIGPFASAAADPAQRERAVAAMVRAGHSFALARAVARLAPGAEVDLEQLADKARLTLT